MNKLANENLISHMPNDLYLPMFGVQDTRTASGQKLLDAINTASAVAQTSHGTFNSVVAKLFSDNVFKSIVSENPGDRSSTSLRQAFAPVVRYMHFLRDISPMASILGGTIDPRQKQDFFRYVARITQLAERNISQSNIAERVPLFFFKAFLQKTLPPLTAATWLNQYQQKPLPLDYDKGVENMARSISPNNVHKELAFIAKDNIDILAHELLAIGNNQVKNIKATTLYKAYQLFIDRIFQEPTFTNVFSTAPQWLKNDINFMRRAIGQNADSLLDASLEIQQSRALVIQALQQSPNLILRLPQEYRHDLDYVLTALQGNGQLLQHMEEQFRQDFSAVLAAVTSNWSALQYAHEDLTKNEEIVLEAVRQHGGQGLAHASTFLTNNADFMLKATSIHETSLRYASDELKNNSDFMFKAACTLLNILYDISDELANNRDFMLKAARIEPIFFHYASDELKNDSDFMLEAGRIYPGTLHYSSNELKNNRGFMLKAAHIRPAILYHASDELKNDSDFMLKATNIDPEFVRQSSNELKNNRDFMLKAVRIDRGCICSASKELLNNKDFILEAALTSPAVLYYASTELRMDKDFIDTARLINPYFQ